MATNTPDLIDDALAALETLRDTGKPPDPSGRRVVNGTIRKVMADKSYGFIAGDDGHEYVLRRESIVDGSVFEQLRMGQSVTFDTSVSDKGPRAENVRIHE